MSRKMEYQHNDGLYYWNEYNKGKKMESRSFDSIRVVLLNKKQLSMYYYVPTFPFFPIDFSVKV